MTRRPPPAEISFRNMRFLIIDCPTDRTLPQFIETLTNANAQVVVRVCDPTYDADVLKKEGILVMDWAFDDGMAPPPQIIDDWCNLLKERFSESPGCCVAVHCVAGLGRAPVLVALALMEAGMKCEDAVAFIREKRRGAINQKQLTFLTNYKPRSRLRMKKECAIMWISRHISTKKKQIALFSFCPCSVYK